MAHLLLCLVLFGVMHWQATGSIMIFNDVASIRVEWLTFSGVRRWESTNESLRAHGFPVITSVSSNKKESAWMSFIVHRARADDGIPT